MALAAGFFHTCAVLSGGGVDCWGANMYGQLGTGDATEKLTPTGVTELTAGTKFCKICIQYISCSFYYSKMYV